MCPCILLCSVLCANMTGSARSRTQGTLRAPLRTIFCGIAAHELGMCVVSTAAFTIHEVNPLRCNSPSFDFLGCMISNSVQISLPDRMFVPVKDDRIVICYTCKCSHVNVFVLTVGVIHSPALKSI
jgi:hypothetical protein